MAFAIETFNDVNPLGGMVRRAGKPPRQQKSLRLEKRPALEKSNGLLIGTVVVGGAVAASAWMMATIAAMMTVTVSLAPDTGIGGFSGFRTEPKSLAIALVAHDRPFRTATLPRLEMPAAIGGQAQGAIADARRPAMSAEGFADRFASSATTGTSPAAEGRGRTIMPSAVVASVLRQKLAPLLAEAATHAATVASTKAPPSMTFARLEGAPPAVSAPSAQTVTATVASAAPHAAGALAETRPQPGRLPVMAAASAELALADAASSAVRGVAAVTPSAPSVAHLKNTPQLLASTTSPSRPESPAKPASASGPVAASSPVDAAIAMSAARLAAATPPQPPRPVETAMLSPAPASAHLPPSLPARPAAEAAQSRPASAIAAVARGGNTQAPEDNSDGSPFDLVLANARPAQDDDGTGDIPLPARRPEPAAGKAPPRAPERLSQSPRQALAYAPTNDENDDDVRSYGRRPSVAGAHDRAAIYDIKAGTVYLPSGERLEAHSGLGGMFDNPRYVSQKNRGPTPPNIYELTLREQLFHGVEALRLNPVDNGKMFGRDGILAHTYMLGRRGDSNGCVSFKDYRRFLAAFKRGEVTRLVVVTSLGGGAPDSRVASR